MKDQFTRMELFRQIMRIANPQMQDADFQDMDTYLILSNFTRIFNIRQILYIFSVCNPKVQGIGRATALLEQVCCNLSKEFQKSYPDYSLDGMNIYALLEMELRHGFGDSEYDSMDITLQMHRIALAGLMAEVHFQIKWADYCILKAKQRIRNRIVMKQKTEHLIQNAEKRKKFWMQFEADYRIYTKSKSCSCHPLLHTMGSSELFQKFEKKKICLHDMVLKNTISFLHYMYQCKTSAVAETFFSLYVPYMDALDSDSMSMQLLSGHIQYFRAANVTKIMYLMDQYGIEYMYKGYDMSVFLSEPLSVAGYDLSNPLCIGEEQMTGTLNNDMEILSGGYHGFSETEAAMFLFCSYLNIEREWMLFEGEKEDTPLIHTVARIVPYISPSFGAMMVDEWYSYCCDSMHYFDMQNIISGKILKFGKQEENHE